MSSTINMLNFIKKSPSCFHVVNNLKNELLEQGFIQLSESEKWKLSKGKKYFVERNNSSIISFTVPQTDFKAFMICASHSDSPCFKIKENPELKKSGAVCLNVEKYGGMLLNPWFDRTLSIAGRVFISKELNTDEPQSLIQEILVNFDRDLVYIPNLAIHFNRDANDGKKIDVQSEICPVISGNAEFNFKQFLAKELNVPEEKIISHDLYIYNRDEGKIWGENNEFISSPRLDDLECVYTSFKAFLNSTEKNTGNVLVHAVFDNEETGSLSRQGADSTFLSDILKRINLCLGKNDEDFQIAVSKSFMLSADNAHAVHPNYASSSDPVNRPEVNKGPVIKFNAAQKYTTDGLSAAVFKTICKNADVPCQVFTNNSNVAGGSTLGNISNSHVSLRSADIGLAQWAMHSPNESAGALDVDYMIGAITEFYGLEGI